MLKSLRARTDIRRRAGEIYGAIVTQARQPDFYASLGIADTPVGRYEMVVLHLFLVIERLRRVPAAGDLPRLLVEAFVADMDDSARELGTGDLAVAKKVRRAASGLYERSTDYKAPLAEKDEAGLATALARHVFDGAETEPHAHALAAYAVSATRQLAAQDDASIITGRIVFPAVASMPEVAP